DVPPHSASEITVGPFEWKPYEAGDDCMIMVAEAAGDASNIGNFSPDESIPEWRLGPHDNNIGQRNVVSIDGSGSKSLLAGFHGRRIHVKNPQAKRARMVLKPILPPLLAKRNWRVEFVSPGGPTFSLEPLASRDVAMRLKRGKTFTAKDVRSARNS